MKLTDVGGAVHGRTTNGGVDVDLDGATWQGEGLDVETSNGGVRLRIPEQYSARLEAGTVNGGISVDMPITLQGRIDRRDLDESRRRRTADPACAPTTAASSVTKK